MLVGKLNDQSSFWIDGDQKNRMDEDLSTPQITFKNEEVLSSYFEGANMMAVFESVREYGIPNDVQNGDIYYWTDNLTSLLIPYDIRIK